MKERLPHDVQYLTWGAVQVASGPESSTRDCRMLSAALTSVRLPCCMNASSACSSICLHHTQGARKEHARATPRSKQEQCQHGTVVCISMFRQALVIRLLPVRDERACCPKDPKETRAVLPINHNRTEGECLEAQGVRFPPNRAVGWTTGSAVGRGTCPFTTKTFRSCCLFLWSCTL